jgi:hypothetical protein
VPVLQPCKFVENLRIEAANSVRETRGKAWNTAGQLDGRAASGALPPQGPNGFIRQKGL